MMNFREELTDIKREKLTLQAGYEVLMNSIFHQILEYFREKEVSEFSEGTEILFSKDPNNRISGTVYKAGKLDRSANFVADAKSTEEAIMTLVFLEQKFKNEHFLLLPETTVSRDGCFSVIIKI